MWNKHGPPMGLPPPPPQSAIFAPPLSSNPQKQRIMGPPPSLLGYPGGPPGGLITGLHPPTANNIPRPFGPIINSHQCWILFQLINIVIYMFNYFTYNL